MQYKVIPASPHIIYSPIIEKYSGTWLYNDILIVSQKIIIGVSILTPKAIVIVVTAQIFINAMHIRQI